MLLVHLDTLENEKIEVHFFWIIFFEVVIGILTKKLLLDQLGFFLPTKITKDIRSSTPHIVKSRHYGSVALLWQNTKGKCKFANKRVQANGHRSKWLSPGFALHFELRQSKATEEPMYVYLSIFTNTFIFREVAVYMVKSLTTYSVILCYVIRALEHQRPTRRSLRW